MLTPLWVLSSACMCEAATPLPPRTHKFRARCAQRSFLGRPRRRGAETGTGASKSRWAGFRRSMDTISCLPPRSIVKTLDPGLMTLYGPSYGLASGDRWLSTRTKTYCEVMRSGGMEDSWVPWRDVGTGMNAFTLSWRVAWKLCGDSAKVGLATKSPGTVSGEPYTSSAEDEPRSSLGAVLIPSRIQGSSSAQFGPMSRARSADFMCRWKRSTSPLACGWYAVVCLWVTPRSLAIIAQSFEVNWLPRSEDITFGSPKRDIQWYSRVRAQVSVDVSLMGMASGQRVKRSTMVNRWV